MSPFNRTMLELKSVTFYNFPVSFYSFNRTMLELKFQRFYHLFLFD